LVSDNGDDSNAFIFVFADFVNLALIPRERLMNSHEFHTLDRDFREVTISGHLPVVLEKMCRPD
jgi:hypothetical protein